jgi:hypothetical protein
MRQRTGWRASVCVRVAVAVAALTVACAPALRPSAGAVDRAYIGTLCHAILGFREQIVAPERQQVPYLERNIEANEHLLDTMSRATPPDDTKAWHDAWIAAGRANLVKLRASDPSAALDPMDISYDTPLPARLGALFMEMPECTAANQPAP